MTKTQIAEVMGYIGMVLILSSTVPITYSAIFESAELPPLSMVALVDAGLLLYLIRALAQKDILYITANGIGVFLNAILLFLILVR